MDLERREEQLQARLERIAGMEAEILRREKELKARESAKKQVLLRLSPNLWNAVASLAEEDIRSINGEIEFLLTQAVRRRRGKDREDQE